MNIASIVYNIATGGSITLGVASLQAGEFNPFYLFFHLIVIITVSVVIGFMAEIGFINLRKYYYDRLGKRHI